MRTTTIAAFLAVASLAAHAAEPRSFTDHRSLNGDAKLSVRNLAGVIEIEAWDKAEFDLAALLGDSAERIEISGTAADLKVEVKNRKSHSSYGDGDTRLKLRVPAGASLSLDGTSSDIVVRGSKGVLTARSVSGDIDLSVGSRVITVQTVSGDLRLEAPAAKEARLNTVSGDVDVKGASGLLVAESVSGDVEVEGGTFTQLDLKSVSGDIGVQAGFAAEAKVKAESLSGDVRVNAPASLSAEVTMKTFSGDKHSGFDAARDASDGKRMVLKIGEGRGQLTLTSFSGDVTLDKQ
ncbi:MAG: DUF4097 family beta strand repeat-containing protein [Pseudomonadota bacterium]